MTVKIFLSIFLITVSLSLYAQKKKGQAYIDSLLLLLSKAQEDTNKAKLLDLLSFSYSRVDPDAGLKYAHEANTLSGKLGWKMGIASSYADLAINHTRKADYAEAIYYNQKALELFEELGDKKSKAGIFSNLSLIFMAQSDYPKALQYAFRALQLRDHISRSTEASILENIGTIYLEQKNYSKTMEYYTNALKLYEEIGDKAGVARNLGNSGIVEDVKGNYDKALEFHFEALKENEDKGDLYGVQINLANIGYVYCHMHDYSKALDHQFKALEISEDLGLKSSIAINLGNIGETYFAIATDTMKSIRSDDRIPAGKTSILEKSVRYLEKAIRICKELSFVSPQIEFSKYLSDALSLTGDYKKSLEVYKEYHTLQDSVFSQQSKVEQGNLETQRAIELKDRDITIKNKEIEIRKLGAENNRKERIIYISGISFLMVIVVIATGRFIKRNKVHKIVLSEIAHIQSHEVRGPVARIMGLVQLFNHKEPNDPINKELIDYIITEAEKLDEITRRVVKKSTDKSHIH